MRAATRRWLAAALLLVVGVAAAPLGHPRTRAALRWAPGFRPLPEDRRIWLEPGAEPLARQLAGALDGAVARIEAGHGLPFLRPFRVYVSADDGSFARRLGLDPEAPIRGMALWRDVWIAPRAFRFAGKDTHPQSLAHELSHLHVSQHLGLWRQRRRIPTWLIEGLADRVAGTGFEVVTPESARRALLSGRSFSPAAWGPGLTGRSGFGNGIPWPLGHAQSRLFIEYLQDRDPNAFHGSVVRILQGESVENALAFCYGRRMATLWSGFRDSLQPGSGVEHPAPGEAGSRLR